MLDKTSQCPGSILSCSIEATVRGKSVFVAVDLTNLTDRSIYVLTWNIPYDGRLEASPFEVKRDGSPVPYTGVMVKRLAPELHDFVLLGPKEGINTTVNISDYYSMAETGKYTITFDSIVTHFFSDEMIATDQLPEHKIVEVRSNTVTVEVP